MPRSNHFHHSLAHSLTLPLCSFLQFPIPSIHSLNTAYLFNSLKQVLQCSSDFPHPHCLHCSSSSLNSLNCLKDTQYFPCLTVPMCTLPSSCMHRPTNTALCLQKAYKEANFTTFSLVQASNGPTRFYFFCHHSSNTTFLIQSELVSTIILPMSILSRRI